jgi:hypothetical protein
VAKKKKEKRMKTLDIERDSLTVEEVGIDLNHGTMKVLNWIL